METVLLRWGGEKEEWRGTRGWYGPFEAARASQRKTGGRSAREKGGGFGVAGLRSATRKLRNVAVVRKGGGGVGAGK